MPLDKAATAPARTSANVKTPSPCSRRMPGASCNGGRRLCCLGRVRLAFLLNFAEVHALGERSRKNEAKAAKRDQHAKPVGECVRKDNGVIGGVGGLAHRDLLGSTTINASWQSDATVCVHRLTRALPALTPTLR